MKSVKKTKSSKNNNTTTSSSNKVKLSGEQIIELANTAVNVINSGFDWLKEIEKTKQIAIDAQVRIAESNNKLASELAQFEKEMLEIQRRFEIEFKKLDDEYKLKNRQLDLVEKIIDKIDKIEIEIKIYQKEEGLTSQYVMILFEQLHQQKLAYMSNLIQLGQS